MTVEVEYRNDATGRRHSPKAGRSTLKVVIRKLNVSEDTRAVLLRRLELMGNGPDDARHISYSDITGDLLRDFPNLVPSFMEEVKRIKASHRRKQDMMIG